MDKNANEPKSALGKLESFVQELSQKKLWVFGWGLFVTCLGFIGSTIFSIAEQNATINKYNALMHDHIMNERKAKMVTDIVNKVMIAFYDVFNNLDTCGQLMKDTAYQKLAKTVVRGKYRLDDVRGGIDAAAATFSSLYFADKDLTDMVAGFKDDILALDQPLSKLDVFYSMLLGTSKLPDKEFYKIMSSLQARAMIRITQKIEVRKMAFRNAFNRKYELEQADLDAVKAPITIFGLKMKYVLALACGYVGFFAALAIKHYKGKKLAM